MSLIERYLLRQLLGPTLLAVLALSVVAMLSQSLGALDIMVNQGQSAFVLIKLTLLALPQLLVMILPIALFVAALVALNRLHTEQEIVVCFASGMSRWRVISPALRLAGAFTLIALFLSLWIAPLAERTMRDELFRVKTDLAASLIQVGEFAQPAPGLTVYAQSSDAAGSFHNLFVLQRKAEGGDTTFFAARAKITKRNGSPVMIMRDGSEQTLTNAGVLDYLKFDEYIFDLTNFMKKDDLVRYKISDRYMHELLFPDLVQPLTRHERRAMLAEAHARLSAPLYNIAFMAMALAAVIGGAFSRLGYGRRIVAVGAAAAAARILGFAVQAACAGSVWLNALQYAIPLAAAGWAFAELFRQRARRPLAPRPLADRTTPSGALA